MKATISKGFGYFFLVLAWVMQVTLILISVRETTGANDFQFWIIVILSVIYFACLLMTFWRQTISGLLLIAAAFFVGIPNFILFFGAGVIFGLPPLIAGAGFLLADMFTKAERGSAA